MAEVFKIAIIGSGPAGLSAAAHAAKKGLSHILLEKTDHLSDTIYRYQKGKHVMAEPEALTDFAEPVSMATWEPRRGEYLVFERSNGGDEADQHPDQ